MSDESTRRPLRIIPVATPPQTPQAVPYQVERFQRALMPSRALTVDRARARAATSSAPAAAPSASSEPDPGPREPTPARPSKPASPATAGTDRPRPPIATVAIEPQVLASPEAPPEPQAGEPGSDAVDPDEGGTGGWDDGIVRVVLMLVRQTDPSIEAWTVTVPLDARVLPDSALELSLSRYRLSLRFVTQSVEAHRLLLSHREALASKLRKGLNRSRDIDIEVN